MSIESRPPSDKIIFQDLNSEWCVISYMNNLDQSIYAIRHCCTTIQQISGGFKEPAFIYRQSTKLMAEECQYCHTVAPESIQAVFMFLVMK